jgi:hypothetical protein
MTGFRTQSHRDSADDTVVRLWIVGEAVSEHLPLCGLTLRETVNLPTFGAAREIACSMTA